ncbi:Protein MEMO1 [Sarcoptes scabiei]|uniref:GRAM domain-containing protein 1B n=1 Tax=Sarcoptes scabiei TaxID=52283 RepID=A0A834QZT9_SARSC|nr:Protein MEMO1 [Sarcoptes scabiei]
MSISNPEIHYHRYKKNISINPNNVKMIDTICDQKRIERYDENRIHSPTRKEKNLADNFLNSAASSSSEDFNRVYSVDKSKAESSKSTESYCDIMSDKKSIENSTLTIPYKVSDSNSEEVFAEKKSSSSSLCSSTSISSSLDATSIDVPKRFHGEDSYSNASKPISEGRQWYHLWLPSYKSRLNQFQRQFSIISPKEKLIDDFVCAIQRELLLQGRMYVSLNYISFYSNIFGYETVINISYQDISSISKASTVKLFPNAIQIITNSGLKYFFTSFVSRERAFQLINRLWQLARREQPMPWVEIRKLIRQSYTTHGLSFDLSDIEDSSKDFELKKKKFRQLKVKNKSKLDKSYDSRSNDSTIDSSLKQSVNIITKSNVDVQTDNLDHQCSFLDVTSQFYRNVKAKFNWITLKSSEKSHSIKFIFLLALCLFILQIGLFLRLTVMSLKISETQKFFQKSSTSNVETFI